MQTISEIVERGFGPALAVQRGKNHWCDDRLNMMTEKGYIRFVPYSPVHCVDGRIINMEMLRIPVTWTAGDELHNPTEEKKVALARCLIENAIDSMEDLLLSRLSRQADLLIGLEFAPWRSPVFYLKESHAFCFLLCVAVAEVPHG